MPIGGFGGPSGRRVHSVERALSASTLLPTVAFAALGAVTVLLVAQMGISPLGAVGGPSARDGGRGVTMPRMSISIGHHGCTVPHQREIARPPPRILRQVRQVRQRSSLLVQWRTPTRQRAFARAPPLMLNRRP